MGQAVPNAAALREAANWLAHLHSGRAGPEDWEACAAWRRADAGHEQAWQRAERFAGKLAALPTGVGRTVLVRPRQRRAVLRSLALLGTAAPAAWLAWNQASWLHSDLRTGTGERREFALPDGSRILLDSASAVDLRFGDRQRHVLLRAGAIRISTASDSALQPRPFIVQTAHAELRALGTRFVVRQADGQAATALAVEQGAVEVTLRHATAPAGVIAAGQQTRISAAGMASATPLAPESLAWVGGMLFADNLRLEDLCAELARYRPGILHCSAEVAGLRVSGAFQLDDTDYALAMLATAFPVRVVTRTRYWVTLLPA